MFFNSWEDVGRTFIVGAFAYLALIAILRISGKRTLTKMSAFDLVVSVALGSVLATILLSEDVALAEGISAYITLIGLQYIIAWTSIRSKTVQRLIKAEPTLLLFNGEFIDSSMRRERITEDEITAAIRAQGIARIEDTAAVVLEADGSFTAIAQSKSGTLTVLRDVQSHGTSKP